jgi:hypothetical protein
LNNKFKVKTNVLSLFLSFILIAGTVTAIFPSSSFTMTANAQAQPYYYDDDGMNDNNNNYYESPEYQSSYYGGKDNNYKSTKDSTSLNKIKCINDNININGENAGDVNIGNKGGIAEEEGYLGSYSSKDGGGYGGAGYDGYSKKGFDDCIINNNNTNTNIAIGEGNQSVPSEPEPEPEPTTATLTVKKQVFGCDNIFVDMDCQNLQNNSSAPWLDCNTNPAISGTIFCQSLSESIFDIEVLDDQNNQIQEFVGSEEGTTIENLEPGTYTVNEIKNPTFALNQLFDNPSLEEACINLNGFSDGGELFNSTSSINFDICFEYEDEQGNDCSTITLAAGEERTCTVKNYIRFGNAVA